MTVGQSNRAAWADPLRSARTAVYGGRFREAWDELVRASQEAQASAEWQLLAAMASWRLGEFARSRAAALQARDRFRAIGDVDGEMRTENVAAAGAFAIGDLTDAERRFSRALMLADELADDLMSARCANNLGNVAYYLARNTTALSFYRLALAGFEKLGWWKGIAEAWLNTTIVWRDSGDLEASRDAAGRALDAAEQAGDSRIFGQALGASSETYALLGDLELARAQAGRALVIAESHDDPLNEADYLRVLSAIERLAGLPEQAEELGRRALAAAQRVQHPWTVADVQRELGDLYAATGRNADAARAYREAASSFLKAGSAARAEQLRRRAVSVEP